MINIAQDSLVENPIFFIHGAYQSPMFWSFLFDDFINYQKTYNCMFLSVPCYYKPVISEDINDVIDHFFYKIKPIVETSKHITIVGHSLGAIIAVRLLNMIKGVNVSLFLSSVPLFLPNGIIPIRMWIEKFIFRASNQIPRNIIPRVLRPKLLTNYHESNFLDKVLTIDLQHEFEKNIDVLKNVHISCGSFDFLSGGIKTQLNFVNEIKEIGIDTKFTNLGYCSHYPQMFSKNRYFQWLVKNL